MENFFSRNHYPRSGSTIMASAPKVVSIPVRFIGPEKTRTGSATKIQKVFRGFFVRKSVNKVLKIQREIHEIEEKLNVDLIRNHHANERIRVHELLMNLLFQLDSVKAFDFGLRALRKSVILQAIALQEKVDSIANGQFRSIDSADNCNHQIQNAESESRLSSSQADQIAEEEEVHSLSIVNNSDDVHIAIDQRVIEFADNCNEIENADTAIAESESVASEVPSANADGIEKKDELQKAEEDDDDNDNCNDMSEVESEMDSSANPTNLVEEVVENTGVKEEDEEEKMRVKGREDDEKKREILEKMVLDNKKMMEMMVDLFQRNEMQTRLLSLLSLRVDQLEKVFVSQKLRRKKKKRNASTFDASKKSPKSNKFIE